MSLILKKSPQFFFFSFSKFPTKLFFKLVSVLLYFLNCLRKTTGLVSFEDLSFVSLKKIPQPTATERWLYFLLVLYEWGLLRYPFIVVMLDMDYYFIVWLILYFWMFNYFKRSMNWCVIPYCVRENVRDVLQNSGQQVFNSFIFFFLYWFNCFIFQSQFISPWLRK